MQIDIKKIFKRRRIKKPNARISWSMIQSMALIFLFFGLASTVYFVYINIAEALKSSEEIIILRKEVIPEIYNIDDFEKVLLIQKEKVKTDDPFLWEDVKNPFKQEALIIENFDTPPEIPVAR